MFKQRMWRAYSTLIVLTCLLLIILVGSVKCLEKPKVIVDPSETSFKTPCLGACFNVNISLLEATNVQAFEFKVCWNSTFLELLNVEIHEFLNSPYSIVANETDKEAGVYWLGIISTSPEPTSGSGTLATLTFNIIYEPVWPGNVTSKIDLTDTKLSNPEGNLIDHDTHYGTYYCYSTPPLDINVKAREESFLVEGIKIEGFVTYGYETVTDCMVSIQVMDPYQKIITIRTIATGPVEEGKVRIVEFYSCDSNGDPKDTFSRGGLMFFKVTILNEEANSYPILLLINIYDSQRIALGTLSFEGSISPGTSSFIYSFGIPSFANKGTATAHICILSGKPFTSGYAYSPEKYDIFHIGESTTISFTNTTVNGNFALNFNLPFTRKPGNYTVFLSVKYMEKQTSVSTVILIKVPDLNLDNTVDIYDCIIISKSYGSTSESPNWNEIADLNKDGMIDIYDLIILARHFGWEA